MVYISLRSAFRCPGLVSHWQLSLAEPCPVPGVEVAVIPDPQATGSADGDAMVTQEAQRDQPATLLHDVPLTGQRG